MDAEIRPTRIRGLNLVTVTVGAEKVYITVDEKGGVSGVYSTADGIIMGGLTEDEVKRL